MTVADVRDLCSFDNWATARLLTGVSSLSEQQFSTEVRSSFPSLRDTVAHIIAEDGIWLRRCMGENPLSTPAWAQNASPSVLAKAFAEVQQDRVVFFAGLTDARLAEHVDFVSLEGQPRRQRIADMLVHIVNHSTYHRGQATTLLRQAGVVPPETDFVVYREIA